MKQISNLFSFFLLYVTIPISQVFAVTCGAQDSFDECTQVSPPPGSTITSETGLVGTLLSEILPIVLVIAGFVTVIMIILSGLQFVTSNGNPEAAAAARSRLLYAVIGFAIVVLSFAILRVINSIFLGTTIV